MSIWPSVNVSSGLEIGIFREHNGMQLEHTPLSPHCWGPPPHHSLAVTLGLLQVPTLQLPTLRKTHPTHQTLAQDS